MPWYTMRTSDLISFGVSSSVIFALICSAVNGA